MSSIWDETEAEVKSSASLSALWGTVIRWIVFQISFWIFHTS